MTWLKPIRLEGRCVRLEPLALRHCADLCLAVEETELWNLWYTKIPKPDEMEQEIERRLKLQDEGSMLPFAVIELESASCVGMTTYMNIDAVNRRVEIGSTWYGQKVHRTGLNTEAKLLLLKHAFESLSCIAVEFRTSSFNFQSQKAIARLGAKLDGILRNHSLHTNGTLRDTYVYSIIASEWPSVKTHLTFLAEQKYK